MAAGELFLNGTEVDWVLDDGRRIPGTVIGPATSASFFPGEAKWNVDLGGGQVRILEGRDITKRLVQAFQPPPPTPILEEQVMEIESFADPLILTDAGRVTIATEPGADLRDNLAGFPALPIGGGVIALTRLLPGLSGASSGAVRAFASQWTRGAIVLWDVLPGPIQAIIQLAGFAGAGLLIDQVFFSGNGDGGGMVSDLPATINAQIIGTWVANGVTFYRLSDGRLAVQNKKGRWKVWRPKKPIVLMPTGAGDLRTLLRADRVLNKQAKQIASMLNRRAPRRQKAQKNGHEHGQTVVVDSKGTVI